MVQLFQYIPGLLPTHCFIIHYTVVSSSHCLVSGWGQCES